MPGPILGALVAGLGGSLISGLASSNAADAASDSSEAQMQLQADMFNRQDDLSGKMLRRNYKSIKNALRKSQDLNELGRDEQIGAQERNRGMFRGEMQSGTHRLQAARGKNINSLQNARGRNVNMFQNAQQKSLQPFKLGSRLGNNALRAYAENLGVGNAPGYSLEMTPGNRYLLDEGQKSLQGSAAAAGGLYSGAAMEELQQQAMGIAAQDRGQQQSELMNLGQLGQNANNSMAGIRGNYSGAIANQRNMTTGGIMDQRTGAANGINALRSGYTGAIADSNTGIGNAWGNYAAQGQNLLQNRLNAIMSARSDRSNLMGSAAQNYANGGSYALSNQGQAGMMGAMGWGNALAGGINAGFGTYGAMGGQFPGQQTQQPFQPQPTSFGTGMGWNTY